MSCNRCAKQSGGAMVGSGVASSHQAEAIFSRSNNAAATTPNRTRRNGRPPHPHKSAPAPEKGKEYGAVGTNSAGRLHCRTCGQFVSQTGNHTCPYTGTLAQMQAAITRRTGVPAEAFGDGYIQSLMAEAKEHGTVTMFHSVTGESIESTLDAIPLAMTLGYRGQQWDGQDGMAVANDQGQVFNISHPDLAGDLQPIPLSNDPVAQVAAAYGLNLAADSPVVSAGGATPIYDFRIPDSPGEPSGDVPAAPKRLQIIQVGSMTPPNALAWLKGLPGKLKPGNITTAIRSVLSSPEYARQLLVNQAICPLLTPDQRNLLIQTIIRDPDVAGSYLEGEKVTWDYLKDLTTDQIQACVDAATQAPKAAARLIDMAYENSASKGSPHESNNLSDTQLEQLVQAAIRDPDAAIYVLERHIEARRTHTRSGFHLLHPNERTALIRAVATDPTRVSKIIEIIRITPVEQDVVNTMVDTVARDARAALESYRHISNVPSTLINAKQREALINAITSDPSIAWEFVKNHLPISGRVSDEDAHKVVTALVQTHAQRSPENADPGQTIATPTESTASQLSLPLLTGRPNPNDQLFLEQIQNLNMGTWERFESVINNTPDFPEHLKAEVELLILSRGGYRTTSEDTRNERLSVVARDPGRSALLLLRNDLLETTDKDRLIKTVCQTPDSAARILCNYLHPLNKSQVSQLVASCQSSPRAAAKLFTDRKSTNPVVRDTIDGKKQALLKTIATDPEQSATVLCLGDHAFLSLTPQELDELTDSAIKHPHTLAQIIGDPPYPYSVPAIRNIPSLLIKKLLDTVADRPHILEPGYFNLLSGLQNGEKNVYPYRQQILDMATATPRMATRALDHFSQHEVLEFTSDVAGSPFVQRCIAAVAQSPRHAKWALAAWTGMKTLAANQPEMVDMLVSAAAKTPDDAHGLISVVSNWSNRNQRKQLETLMIGVSTSPENSRLLLRGFSSLKFDNRRIKPEDKVQYIHHLIRGVGQSPDDARQLLTAIAYLPNANRQVLDVLRQDREDEGDLLNGLVDAVATNPECSTILVADAIHNWEKDNYPISPDHFNQIVTAAIHPDSGYLLGERIIHSKKAVKDDAPVTPRQWAMMERVYLQSGGN